MSSKTIIIRQTGMQFDAQEGQNILQAALENGIVYPYGCRQGRCGGCKTRLVQGQVDLLDYSRFALTEAQSARGLILACRAIPRSDVTLDWIGTDDVRGRVPLRQVEGTVVTLEALTHDIRRVRIRLADEQPLMFFAGQYADIKFGQAPARSYCMANRPGEAELEFHIRRVPGGVASAYVHTVLEPGERVTLELPKGTSYLREGHGGPMLCIAGGAGLAPIKSIVETGLEEFRALARDYPTLLFTPVVSGIPVAHCSRGLVTDIAGSEQADLRGWKVYVAGSPTLVDATIGMALKRGLKIQDLHAQIYVTP
jgi:ferredoxin-NAD(P)+ reductase (naphthalene dioxygenase ferredoxin-specific)